MPPNNWNQFFQETQKRVKELEKQWNDGEVIHPSMGDVDLFVKPRLKSEPEPRETLRTVLKEGI